MLSYTSWIDLKTREIYDTVWIIFGSIGLLISLYEVYTGNLSLMILVVVVFVSSVISFGLGYFGLVGGADVLAFITLTILHPLPPRGFEPCLGLVSPIFSLTLFSNSALSGVFYSLVQFVRNIVLVIQGETIFIGVEDSSTLKKIIVMFTGQRMKMNHIRGPPFQYPLEIPQSDEGSDRRLILMPDIQDDNLAKSVFDKLKTLCLEEVWVSNTLPFLIFITIGYLLSLTLGDIALAAIKPLLIG
jgi:preflagellin peptidase FlaK